MLTLYGFNGMDENAQAEAIFKEGVYVDSHNEENLKVQLYRLDSFYIEVFMIPGRTKSPGIVRLSPLAS